MRRITTAATTSLVTLMLASPAYAQESGAGHIEAADKTITEFGFGMIVAFPIFVWLMSRLQGALDKRKDRKKAAFRKSKSSAAWRGGW
ncbi:MAG: hypothetical protein AAGC46_20785 [Solirubrobacteraceae bacterium]